MLLSRLRPLILFVLASFGNNGDDGLIIPRQCHGMNRESYVFRVEFAFQSNEIGCGIKRTTRSRSPKPNSIRVPEQATRCSGLLGDFKLMMASHAPKQNSLGLSGVLICIVRFWRSA
jgi:hypothetical protein